MTSLTYTVKKNTWQKQDRGLNIKTKTGNLLLILTAGSGSSAKQNTKFTATLIQ